jgi:hypothetical protein
VTEAVDLSRSVDELRAARYKIAGWEWFKDQAKTFDEHDATNPVKPFPTGKKYLEITHHIWQETPWLLVEKTRQIMYSWLFVGEHLHLAQFTPYRRVLLGSRTDDEAYALLQRHWFMYENQDEWLKKLYPATLVGNEMLFEDGSVLTAIPKGKNKVRSYVCSALFADEFFFQEDGEEMFGAAVPALTGGGRFTGVSTANPGFGEGLMRAAKKAARRQASPIKGMDFWQGAPEIVGGSGLMSEANDLATGFSVLRTHYSADPDPYTQKKVAEARAKYASVGRQAWFNKEYEIVYDALSGELVWPQLDREVHGIKPFTIPDEWTRIRVIDPGYRNPTAVLWMAVSPPGWRGCRDVETGRDLSVLVIYQEMYETKWSVPQLVAEIKRRSGKETYSVNLIDPSANMHKGNETAGRSTAEQFTELGIPVILANNSVEAGLDEVRRRMGVYDQSPALLIFDNLENCWREALSYRYKEFSAKALEQMDAPEQVRKKGDHFPDDIRYGCQWRPLPSKGTAKAVPRGSFAHFQRQDKLAREQRNLLGNTHVPRWVR